MEQALHKGVPCYIWNKFWGDVIFLAEYRLPYPHITAANTSHRYLSNQCLGSVYTFIFGTWCNQILTTLTASFSLSRQNRKYTQKRDLFWEWGHCINFCPFNIWQHLFLFLVLLDGHSMEQEKTVTDKNLLLKLLIEEYSYPFWNIIVLQLHFHRTMNMTVPLPIWIAQHTSMVN